MCLFSSNKLFISKNEFGDIILVQREGIRYKRPHFNIGYPSNKHQQKNFGFSVVCKYQPIPQFLDLKIKRHWNKICVLLQTAYFSLVASFQIKMNHLMPDHLSLNSGSSNYLDSRPCQAKLKTEKKCVSMYTYLNIPMYFE